MREQNKGQLPTPDTMMLIEARVGDVWATHSPHLFGGVNLKNAGHWEGEGKSKQFVLDNPVCAGNFRVEKVSGNNKKKKIESVCVTPNCGVKFTFTLSEHRL